jgi:hypothetical protein
VSEKHHKPKPPGGGRDRPAELNGNAITAVGAKSLYHRARRGALVLCDADRQLLATLPDDKRHLVKRAMRHRPGITAAEALNAVRDA